MPSWSNATVTEKGYALQAKLLSTTPLVITKVVAGSGRVPVGQLINQTAVSEEKQTLSVDALSYDNNGNAIIKTTLNNKNLSSGYSCNQIGIYASDPDEGEILYAISQEATTGDPIPSIVEQPNGYYCSWVFTLTFSNSSNISVTIDPANALTKGAADVFYSAIDHTHDERYYTEAETDALISQAQAQINDLASQMNTKLSGKSDNGHYHDDRYYTETEVNSLLAGKSNTSHAHDDRYYTETEVDTKLSGKADKDHSHSEYATTSAMNTALAAKAGKTHSHSVSDLTDVLPIGKGGTNATTEAGARENLKIAGRSCAGETFTIDGEPVVAGVGAEIFNDLSERIYGSGFPQQGNVAVGDYAHAEGYGTTADGVAAHSEGYLTRARGLASHASGAVTIASELQFVTGRRNREVNGPAELDEQSADSSIFIIGYGTSTTPANAFRVTSAGKCYGSASFIGSGADFPEFEEWADGNPDNEDRRGLFVALDGDKIVLASSEKDHIIGVVSAMGAFIANGASENWQGMYLKDVFGENLTQRVEIPEKTIEKKVLETDADGKHVEKTITEVIPAHTVTQFVVNPDYNPDEKYIGREFRKEWAPVGKLGQVIVVDDGTCTVGGYCKPSANGIGTAGEYGYYVRKRIDSTHIKVEVSPGAFNK